MFGTIFTYICKNANAKVELYSPTSVLSMGTRIKNPMSLKISLGYNYRNWHFTINAKNPFMNKKTTTVGSFEKTIIQLSSAGITIIPYTLFFEKISFNAIDTTDIFLVFILGLVHTGLAYYLYFSSLKNIKGQTAAIYSYIDPIFAILLSIFILKENMNIFTIIGSIIILASTLLSEINIKKVGS